MSNYFSSWNARSGDHIDPLGEALRLPAVNHPEAVYPAVCHAQELAVVAAGGQRRRHALQQFFRRQLRCGTCRAPQQQTQRQHPALDRARPQGLRDSTSTTGAATEGLTGAMAGTGSATKPVSTLRRASGPLTSEWATT